MCRILEYQFPLRYQLFLEFLKGFRNTTEVKLSNFQDSIQSRAFDSNSIKAQSLTLPENVAFNHNVCEQFQDISSLKDILAAP